MLAAAVPKAESIPDTRNMIPADFGLAIGNFVVVGHAVRHKRTDVLRPTAGQTPRRR